MMLQRLFIGSCATLLLVGCTTTETKPVTSDTPNIPAKVAQPAAKAVKPAQAVVSKPDRVSNLSVVTHPTQVEPPAITCPYLELSEEWASCAVAIKIFYDYGINYNNIKSSKLGNSPTAVAAFNRLPFLSEVYLAYASKATNVGVVATAYQRSHNVYSPCAENTFRKKGTPVWFFKKLRQCHLSLQKNHARFDAQVEPRLRYSVLDKIQKLHWP